jgi:hypothetical protein
MMRRKKLLSYSLSCWRKYDKTLAPSLVLPPCPPKGGFVLENELIFAKNVDKPPFRGPDSYREAGENLRGWGQKVTK